jgi:hypothetical protein
MDQPPAEGNFRDENKKDTLGERLDKPWTRLQLWWKAKYMALSGIEPWSSSNQPFMSCNWTHDIWLVTIPVKQWMSCHC